MIHYHGTPITPRERLYELAGRHFCVSFSDPRDVKICHEIGQSVMLDNGAYLAWKQNTTPDWEAWADWVRPWLDYPTTWAVLPDKIDGSEKENDYLVGTYAWLTDACAPVWHLHESFARLKRLCDTYSRICFGSSGHYAEVGSFRWHVRICGAFNAIADEHGRVPWIHMLRGMKMSGTRYPFASADSTDIARNHSRGSWTVEKRARYWDSQNNPGRWQTIPIQSTLEVA